MKLQDKDFYKLLVRPVVVVSTISKRGISNAAPFSFNSPISFSPPLFGISSQPKHHTWKNIKESHEFVINVVGEDFGPLMHILEQKFPYEVSEIAKAGLTEEKSKVVKPPRIKEAYAWLECKLEHYVELGDHVWITGRVLVAEVKDEAWKGVIDVEKAKPLNHISGKFFVSDMKTKKFRRA